MAIRRPNTSDSRHGESITRASRAAATATSPLHPGQRLRLPPELLSLSSRQTPSFRRPGCIGNTRHTPVHPVLQGEAQPLRPGSSSQRKLPSTISPRDRNQGIGVSRRFYRQRPLLTLWHPSPSRCHLRLRPSPERAGDIAPDPPQGQAWVPRRSAPPAHTFRRQPRPAAPKSRTPSNGGGGGGRSPCQRQRPPAGHATASVSSERHSQLAGELLAWPRFRQGGATEGSRGADRAIPVDKRTSSLMSGQTLATSPTAGQQRTTSTWQRSLLKLGSKRQRLALEGKPKRSADALATLGGVTRGLLLWSGLRDPPSWSEAIRKTAPNPRVSLSFPPPAGTGNRQAKASFFPWSPPGHAPCQRQIRSLIKRRRKRHLNDRPPARRLPGAVPSGGHGRATWRLATITGPIAIGHCSPRPISSGSQPFFGRGNALAFRRGNAQRAGRCG